MSGLNWTPEQVAAHYQRLGLEPPKGLGAVNKQNKYRNIKKVVDGIEFDSSKEARRYSELKLMRDAGVITDLQLQPRFLLQDGVVVNGKKQRAIEYRGDFSFVENGRHVVEDVKSPATRTQTYLLKKKLLLAAYADITFREVL